MLFRIVVTYETIWSLLSISVFPLLYTTLHTFKYIFTLSTEHFEDEKIMMCVSEEVCFSINTLSVYHYELANS